MKRKIFIACLMLASQLNFAQDWKPAGSKILSPWGEKVTAQQPHPEYPRPMLVRENNWQNLNGLWNYAITAADRKDFPETWEGHILVPFAVESALSGVGKEVGKDKALWYQRTISIDKNVNKDNILLHFGAVDWQCDVYVNNSLVGRHEGGFNSFSMDITKFVKKGAKQDVVIRVWDPTDDGPQPRGKQIKNPHGIWYTPVTGIWQTVWLESVPSTYIANTKQTPQFDVGKLTFEANVEGSQAGDQIKVAVLDGKKQIKAQVLDANTTVDIHVPNLEAWSPSNPKLYDLDIQLIRNGKVIDKTKSYFAMRKISMEKDKNGIQRMMLNNKFVFQYGPLDQGWWPDGLHTAPSDEALKFDVIKTKEMGFNMIRKHIKVEPARWYRHCDSIGMLVWQDMPSGDLGGKSWDMQPGKISGDLRDKNRSAESEGYFRKEWKTIMETLHNYPSIVVWVPFNEAWGQFKTKEITEWTMAFDDSRLTNSASGGNFMYTGHILDIHNYPDAASPDPAVFGSEFILALGEFGGLGLPVDGHTWQQKDNWGYQSFKSKEELLKRYQELIYKLDKLIPMGLSAAVYTQTTDVEVETNGLMTYDRKVIKISEAELDKVHRKLYSH